MKLSRNLFVSSVLALAASSTLHAQTWDGNGTANAGGNWSTAVNWAGDVAPITGNTANLDDTGANRTIVYDTGASGALGTLNLNQSSAFANILDIQRSLTVTNAITLGAASGTERISFNTGNTPTAGSTLTASGGITLNSGGELQLAAFRQASTNTIFQSDITGSVTVAGGTLTVRATDNNAAGNTATSASNTITSNLTMSSGLLVIDNATGLPDRRLSVNGNFNVTGGAISTTLVGTNGTLFLNGGTNTLSPTTFDTDLGITLGAAAQSLTSTVNMGALTLRGTGIKTVTTSGTVGQILLLDGNNGTLGSATALRLGSNLTLSSGATQLSAATFSQSPEATTNITNYAIDTNGFTLDLSTGGSSGVWTPNVGASGNVPTWTLSGTGKIRANAFNLNTATVTTTIASGTTLEAVGGNSTASNLGGTGTVDPNSTFRYAGAAATGTPATLTSNRNLGDIEVASGALRMLTGSTGTVQDLRVTGGTFDLDTNTTRAFATISLTGGTLANGTYATNETDYSGLATGTVSGKLTGAKQLLKSTAGTLTISNSGNDYSGATVISAGTLALGNANALGNTPNLQITGGTLDLGGFSINKFVQTLSNGGTIANGTINRNSATTFFLASGTVSANFTNSGGGVLGLTKNSSGTVTLSGVNNYSGATAVTAGTLFINGNNSTALGVVTVSSNSTLGGIGTVGGTVTVDSGGFIAPGVTAGNLTLNNGLDLNGTYTWDLAALSTANPGTDYDILTVTSGTIDITGATLGLNLGANSPTAIPFWQMNQTWAGILNNTGVGSLTGSFAAINNTAWASLGNFTTTYTGNDVNLVWSAVPEPGFFSRIGGVGILALLRRRRA